MPDCYPDQVTNPGLDSQPVRVLSIGRPTMQKVKQAQTLHRQGGQECESGSEVTNADANEPE